MVYEFGVRLAGRRKSGGPSLGRNPDAQKQRQPAKSKSNLNSRENRVDTIFRAGQTPCSFFRNQSSRLQIMLSANPIEASFELAAARCEDLTPLVYARLHREHPETRAMFRTEGSEFVKGSMLAMTIESIIDLAGERSGKFRMIECEVYSHDAYGTPRELFLAFFGVIAASLRELLGADWSEEIDQAWQNLLTE